MTTLTLLVWNQTGVSELVLSLPKKPQYPQPGDNLLLRLDGPDVPPLGAVASDVVSEVPPMDPKSLARAVRYRQLARAEPDQVKAAILREIADEAERDVLCTADKMDSSLRRARPRQERNSA
jgi:hypothetical protein